MAVSMGRVGSELGRSGFWLSGALSAALLCLSSVAQAQAGDTADDMARRHFESGVAYLEESDYENALRAFQKAYDLSKRPEILLNVAVVQERRGDVAGALAALRQYLDVAPKNTDVDTVRLRIQNLEKRQAAEAPKTTAPVIPPPAAPPPAVPPPAAPPPAPVATAPSRTPMFIAFGVGAVGAASAVVTGILANSEYQSAKSDCSPHCSDGELSAGRVLAVTSTVFTGVALVGVGLGVTLLLLEKPSEGPSTGSLALSVAPTLGGARAGAAWRF
jgi:tetratricopeptide (TPR) repeat protein